MSANRPLAGIRVIDLSRLAPGPYATMLLADMGAEVITVGAGSDAGVAPTVARGKTLIRLDLKSPEGREALHHLVKSADVLVEGFRPGVAARIGAGPDEMCALNPRLVYCSLTGYGQDGPRAQEAGHDINYLASAGVLGAMGPPDAPPTVPLNLIADFGGGSLFAVVGILAALTERARTGIGRRIDAAMVDGCLSMMGMHSEMWGTDFMPARGRGLLDGGAPKCAKKFGEEAIETVIAAISEDNQRLANEAADLVYHLLVLLNANLHNDLGPTVETGERFHWFSSTGRRWMTSAQVIPG